MGDFPGNLVVKILCFHYRECGFNPRLENYDLTCFKAKGISKEKGNSKKTWLWLFLQFSHQNYSLNDFKGNQMVLPVAQGKCHQYQ